MKKIGSILLAVIIILGAFSYSTYASTETTGFSECLKQIGQEEIITPQEAAFQTMIEKKLDRNESLDGLLEKVGTIQKNEYEEIKRIKDEDATSLMKMGMEASTINEIKSFDYEKSLAERSKLEDSELQALGYNKEQINILREFTGTEAQMRALSATITASIYTNGCAYYPSSNQSKHNVVVTWEWNQGPNIFWKDIVGLGWFQGWHISSTSVNKIYYSHCTNDRPIQIVNNSFTAVDTTAAKDVFDLKGTVYGDLDYMWARRGAIYGNLYKQGNDLNSNIMVKYGHANVTLTPSVTTSGISLGFTPTVTEMVAILVQYPAER